MNYLTALGILGVVLIGVAIYYFWQSGKETPVLPFKPSRKKTTRRKVNRKV